MTWKDLTSRQKAETIRPLIETEGLSFSQVAERLGDGVTRLMIAGVVSRSRDRGEPVAAAKPQAQAHRPSGAQGPEGPEAEGPPARRQIQLQSLPAQGPQG